MTDTTNQATCARAYLQATIPTLLYHTGSWIAWLSTKGKTAKNQQIHLDVGIVADSQFLSLNCIFLHRGLKTEHGNDCSTVRGNVKMTAAVLDKCCVSKLTLASLLNIVSLIVFLVAYPLREANRHLCHEELSSLLAL